jgi:hypothetical protein
MNETMEGHIASLPRSVNGKIAKNDDGNLHLFVINPAQMLSAQLADSVRGKRGGGGIFGYHFLRLPIYGRSRGINESLQRGIFTSFQHLLGDKDVVGHIRLKVVTPT